MVFFLLFFTTHEHGVESNKNKKKRKNEEHEDKNQK